MRWIIGLVVIALLVIVGWFMFLRLSPVARVSPFDAMPENTWLIVEAKASKAQVLFTDSNSLFQNLSVLTPISNLVRNASSALSGRDHKITFFLYGSAQMPYIGAIEDVNENESILRDFFSEHTYIGDYTVHSNEVILPTKQDNDHLKKLLLSSSDLGISVCAKPQRIIEFYANHLTSELNLILSSEIVTDEWVGFEMRDEENVFIANGVGSSSSDETSKKRDLNLLRYVPAKTGVAVLGSSDTVAYAMIYCPYSNGLENEHENLFLLFAEENAQVDQISEDQSYQGIPISIGPLPGSMSMFNIKWQTESYIAHFGSVRIHAASFKQLTNLIDDYLADDKLISSAYFKKIEPAISDASFTFYLHPDLLSNENPFIADNAELKDVNTLVFQSFSELPLQKFYALSILHHTAFVDEAPMLWTILLDTAIAAGPWAFVNHYTQENEIIIQDAKHQLYLLNKDGKTLWKQRLDETIVGEVKMIDAFKSKKYQMLFNTRKSTYLLDRNGKTVGEFPLRLNKETSVSPTIVQYDAKGDYRILIADGNTIRNVDIEGKPIKGWNNAQINGKASSPIEYLNYAGKDYLTVISERNSVYFFDRTGKERIKKLQADSTASALTLIRGKSLNECAFIGYDSIGNIHTLQPNSKSSIKNILPIVSDVGLETTDDATHAYITVKKDRVISLNRNLDVELDFLMPEELKKNIQLISKMKGWIGLESQNGEHFYLLDLEGRLLDKMPIKGSGKALLTDLDKNGSQELIIGDGKREMLVYKLAD